MRRLHIRRRGLVDVEVDELPLPPIVLYARTAGRRWRLDNARCFWYFPSTSLLERLGTCSSSLSYETNRQHLYSPNGAHIIYRQSVGIGIRRRLYEALFVFCRIFKKSTTLRQR